MRRLMISSICSNSGKTVLTCALLTALIRKGISVESFKCGPDYIDPMFHRRILGIPSRNLDLFLQGEAGVQRTLSRQRMDFALLEGTMGFYDGVNGTDVSSTWAIADITNVPVILVVRAQGASLSLAAQLQGMMNFRNPSHLVGIVLTECREALFTHLQPIIERETRLNVLGFLPPMEEARLESRHLGLYTAEEISNFSSRFQAIAAQLERTVDIERLMQLAGEVPVQSNVSRKDNPPRCSIAVARDEAFSFYYEDSFDSLRAAGAELNFFSPLRDTELPKADGLYLGGGYPELYAEQLAANLFMRKSICEAVKKGLPTVAECGGFLYLQRMLEDTTGLHYEMAGVFSGDGIKTDRLQRFGYLYLREEKVSMLFRPGEEIPAHEFHYWDSTNSGIALIARKPSGRIWRCGFTSPSLYAAFPHLHLDGELPLAERFVEAAIQWKEKKKK